MIIHSTSQYTIYFGDAKDQMYPAQYQQWNDCSLLSRKPIIPIRERLHLQGLLFLRQVHGSTGRIVSTSQLTSLLPFDQEGDFLITHDQYMGIGIVSADCLPVIVYDRKHHVVGIAHAGWRGAVAGVVVALLEMLKKSYGSEENDLSFLFGPSAKRCCYEVAPLFTTHLEQYSFADQAVHRIADKVFFDLPLFVKLQLQQWGVSPDSFCMEYNSCTMCDTRFHSSRRGTVNEQPHLRGRQMTVVALK